jgi:hypothetical protein
MLLLRKKNVGCINLQQQQSFKPASTPFVSIGISKASGFFSKAHCDLFGCVAVTDSGRATVSLGWAAAPSGSISFGNCWSGIS